MIRPASAMARATAVEARRPRRFVEAVYRLVARVPAGHVVTYGQVASLLDRPRAARAVGTAMRHCPPGFPWHRVVNAQGGISRRGRTASMLTQKIRLEQEGVRLRRGRVSLRRYRWDPDRLVRTPARSTPARWRWEDDES